MTPNTILMVLKLIDLVAMGAQMIPEVKARVDRYSAKIKQMVEEGRDPTPEEWAVLDGETDALMARILEP